MTVREPTGRTPHAIATPRAIVVLNDRRLCLLEQKYRRGACGGPGVGLTAEEQAELNECARVMVAWMEGEARMAGRREVLDEFAGWVAEMRAKVEAKREAGGGPPCPVSCDAE